MIKHATSHSFAVLMCTIISAFLIEILRRYIPNIIGKFEVISSDLIYKFNIPLTVEYLSIAILASILALLWGLFFKLGNTK